MSKKLTTRVEGAPDSQENGRGDYFYFCNRCHASTRRETPLEPRKANCFECGYPYNTPYRSRPE